MDATDRYGFVMPNAGDKGIPAMPTEPAARDRDLEARRISKWRKMLGALPRLFQLSWQNLDYYIVSEGYAIGDIMATPGLKDLSACLRKRLLDGLENLP